jgi:osmoprotectant transport system substrate-binding protein
MIRTRLVLATVLTSALALTACTGGDDPLTSDADQAPSDTVVVGSANFPENVLLAEIYAGALKGRDVKVSKRLNIGSREAYVPGLQDGSIDVIPEYTGNLLQYFTKGAKEVGAGEVYEALKKALPPSLTVLDQASAEDKDSVVVTRETADKYNLTSIGDLKPVAKDLVLGGPAEWKTRATGVPGLKKVYGLEFKSFKSLDAAGPLTVDALKKNQVQAANIFSTDPNIPANNWVALSDRKLLFASQNVVPLMNKAKATPKVSQVLNQVSVMITTPGLAEMVKQVVLDKKDPATVAKDFLAANKLD